MADQQLAALSCVATWASVYAVGLLGGFVGGNDGDDTGAIAGVTVVTVADGWFVVGTLPGSIVPRLKRTMMLAPTMKTASTAKVIFCFMLTILTRAPARCI